MDRAATADARARSSLSKAQEHLKSNDVKDAIEALANHLQNHQLTIVGFQCLELLADLSLTQEKPEVVRLIDVLRRCRSGLRGSQHLEDSVQRVVDLVMSRIRQMCINAKERAEALQANPTDGDKMLAAMSGISLAALAEERHIRPCHFALGRLIRHFCGHNNIGFAKKLTFIYNKTVRQFLSMCKEFNAPSCLLDISTIVSRTISRMALDPLVERDDARSRAAVQEMRKEREDFLASTAAVTEMVETLCCLLNDICTLRQYGGALDVLSCLKSLCDNVQRKEDLTDVVSGAYETMSDIFWTCSLNNYHAYCLCTAASLKRQERRAPLAARAVVASLCVTETDLELDPFVPHRKKTPLIDDLFEYPSTTKASLLEELKLRNVYALAAPEIAKLAANLEDPNFTDFTGLHKTVTALTTANSDLSRYGDELHKVILRYQLECLAATCNHVDVLTLAAYSGNLTAADYVNSFEPVILQDESVSVEIDSRTNTLSFSNSSKAKMLAHYKKIVADVDTVPATRQCNSTGRYSDFSHASPSAAPTPVSVTGADLEAAAARSKALNELHNSCIQKKDRRAEKRKEEEKTRRVKAVQERRDQEQQKQKDTQEAYIAQLYPEYRERQRQERGKEVLRKLRIKYPGFKVDDAIVYRSTAGFEDELTRLLAAFKRRGVDNDRKDILQANLYERAVRALEIPARRAVDAANAERNRAERAAVRGNYLAEHRREYDRRCNERMVLSKFLADADKFEATWRDRASRVKLSKMDEQQRRLDEEKRNIAAA